MWHFFKNPLDLVDAWITIEYYGSTIGSGYINFNGWGLPDTSILELAPTEYILGLKIRYREDKTADWKSFVRNIRCSSEMSESHNIAIFVATMVGGGAYAAAHVFGNLTVSSEYTDNRWGVSIDVAAYFPGDVVQYPQRSSVFEANNVAMQGVNIYY